MEKRIIEENEILRGILADAQIGWWRGDYKRKEYVVSDFVRELFGLDSVIVCFSDLGNMIREDYRMRITSQIENVTNQFKYDQIFPVRCCYGEVWVRSKMLSKATDADGSLIVNGYIQIISNTEINPSEVASPLRLNNLLYQLNSISHTLLSFLQANTSESVINQILGDILKLFKGGRTYIIEYDQKEKTQTCTYEVVDHDVCKEQSRIDHLPMSDTPWWTEQINLGHSIILSNLNDLPAEAATERDFLLIQEIKSMIVVPLISRNGVWGYMGIDIVEDHHEWSNEDCQWFSALANIINICIELQKSERDAQIDRVYLQNLYKYMPLGYVRLKLQYKDGEPVDFVFVDVNYAAEKITGRSSKYYIGNKASELGLQVADRLPYLKSVLDSGNYQEAEYYLDHIGKYCRMVTYSTQKDEWICLFADITESHSVHQALDRSEKILRNIYDNLPAGIELYDKEGFLVDMNNKDVEIFGLRCKEDALGVNVFENPNIPEEIKLKIRNREQVSFRLRYLFESVESYYPSQKSGYIEIYTTASILYDMQGNLINYLLINIDNTEITNAYSRIAEFESSFSVVSEYGKIGYCKFDVYTKEGYGVSQWFRNLGEKDTTPLSQIIGIYTYVHEEDKADILESMRKVKLGEIDNFSRDLRINTVEGQKWTRINVMRNTTNTVPGKLEMICVNYDVTELKKTERELIEAKNKAEVSDRLKSAFLANMSHEIRTPLNAIVGFSNLLADSDDRAERENYISIVQENNDLLLQLISDILDLSKIETGTFEFVQGDVDVNQLCSEINRSFGIKAKGGTVEIRFEKNLPECHIYSDKNRLTQVISNFINNALKFTTEGSITLGYTLTGKDEIKFYVRDTGCGIPKEKQDAVFDRFVKLNNFVQGTGLGLSICKSLIEQMDGCIGVESTLGEGSCFWFTHPYLPELIPVKPKAVADLFIDQSENVEKVLKPTILIAEDTDSNFLLISTILKKDYSLIRAYNGAEAVELFKKIRPDIILMDVKMPVMDGVEATLEIRKADVDIPIIAVTAFAFDRDRQRVIDAGCNDYMPKPIQMNLLKDMIRKYLNE